MNNVEQTNSSGCDRYRARIGARAIELLAAATARFIDANSGRGAANSEHGASVGGGLELADHAALSVPAGERPRPEPENPGRCSPQEPEGR